MKTRHKSKVNPNKFNIFVVNTWKINWLFLGETLPEHAKVLGMNLVYIQVGALWISADQIVQKHKCNICGNSFKKW